RVPDGRLTGLRAQPVALVDREALPALDGAAKRLVLEAVPERGEHEDRPDPWRLDAAPGAVGLLVRAHPALGLPDRDPPQPRGRLRRLAPARTGADLAQPDFRVAHGA